MRIKIGDYIRKQFKYSKKYVIGKVLSIYENNGILWGKIEYISSSNYYKWEAYSYGDLTILLLGFAPDRINEEIHKLTDDEVMVELL